MTGIILNGQNKFVALRVLLLFVQFKHKLLNLLWIL
jgi:hypothetical protein